MSARFPLGKESKSQLAESRCNSATKGEISLQPPSLSAEAAPATVCLPHSMQNLHHVTAWLQEGPTTRCRTHSSLRPRPPPGLTPALAPLQHHPSARSAPLAPFRGSPHHGLCPPTRGSSASTRRHPPASHLPRRIATRLSCSTAPCCSSASSPPAS